MNPDQNFWGHVPPPPSETSKMGGGPRAPHGPPPRTAYELTEAIKRLEL